MAVQADGLRRLFPFGKTAMNHNCVSWHGEIVPDEYGRTYTIELRYKRGSYPKIWVRNPDLKKLADGRRLPHVYSQELQELCLYLPGCGFWTVEKPVASTIMFWACLWLYYFELWLITNEWHGRGVHPS